MALRVVWNPSPNHNPRDRRYPLQGDVSHRIVGSAPSAIGKFTRAGTASSHFVIGHTQIGDPCPQCGPLTGARGGLVITQMVDLSRMAWTNGDVREPSWSRIQPGVNPNLTTITTEHEDMGANAGYLVTPHVWNASKELKRLLRSGSLTAIRAAGIRVSDGAFTAVALVARMAALPANATVYIDHHQISGPNKPWCWRALGKDSGLIPKLPDLLAYLSAPDQEEDVKIRGTWRSHVINQRTKLGVASDIRDGPTTSHDIIGSLPANTYMLPTVRVGGQAIGNLEDATDWYAGWMYLGTSWQFGYYPAAVLLRVAGSPPGPVDWTPVQATAGASEEELKAARAGGIKDAADAAGKVV